MAVYVVLEFADDNEAKDFVKSTLLMEGVSIDLRTYPDDSVDYLKAVPRGVYKKPTLFCECASTSAGGRRQFTGWKRGMKYGWWVCPRCGKPTKKWGEGSSWFSALGINLLPFSKVAHEYRPKGWRSPVEWIELLPLLGPPSDEETSSGPVEG